jgi:creatinine amidohydrolase
MSERSSPVLWEELSWSQIENMIAGGMRTVIWPIGAVEAHGYHLPLLTDALCVDAVAKRVSELTGIPVLPVQTIGVSLGHGRFPGTLSIRPDTLMRIVRDVGDSLYACGVRQLLLLNGHMWNAGTLEAVREELRWDHADLQVKAVSYWMFGDSSEYNDCPEAPQMMHAEFKETAWVLALRPDLVRMEDAVDEEDFHQFWDYRMDQVSSSGVMGRKTTEATAEIGHEIIEITAQALAADLVRARDECIPVPVWKSIPRRDWVAGRQQDGQGS